MRTQLSQNLKSKHKTPVAQREKASCRHLAAGERIFVYFYRQSLLDRSHATTRDFIYRIKIPDPSKIRFSSLCRVWFTTTRINFDSCVLSRKFVRKIRKNIEMNVQKCFFFFLLTRSWLIRKSRPKEKVLAAFEESTSPSTSSKHGDLIRNSNRRIESMS